METREFSFLVALGVGRQGKGTVETQHRFARWFS